MYIYIMCIYMTNRVYPFAYSSTSNRFLKVKCLRTDAE